MATASALQTGHLFDAAFFAAFYLGMVVLLVRFGLVVAAVSVLVNDILSGLPVTADLSAWYAGASLFALLSILAVAIYGFHTALAGRRLFKDELLQG